MAENLYQKLAKEGALEHNSCVPVAFAAATGLDYKSSLYLFKALGRRRNSGTFQRTQHEAARVLGLKTEVIQHPPKRIWEAVAIAKKWEHGALVYVRGHVFFTKDGVIHDWIDKNRRHRVVKILKIIGFDEPAPELNDLIEKGRREYEKTSKNTTKKRNRRSTLEILKDQFGWEDVQEFKGAYGTRSWYITENGIRYKVRVYKAKETRDKIIQYGGLSQIWEKIGGTSVAHIDGVGTRIIYYIQ